MGHADRGVEHPQVIVNFGDGTYGGARAARGGLLLNGDGRRESLDGIHVGPLHLIEKLAGVGGKRFHIAALALGIDGVECQRRFSRAAQSGDHRKAVTGDFDRDVLQVVLAGAANRDLIDGH